MSARNQMAQDEFMTAVSTAPSIADLNEVVRDNILKRWKPEFRNSQIDYHNVEAETKNVTFSALEPREGAPLDLVQVSYINDTKLPQKFLFEDTRETNWRFEVSMTTGFTYKHTATAKLDLKKIISLGGSHEWEISLSTTATVETKISRTFKWSMPIDVAPRTTIIATAIVKTRILEPEFKADLEIVANRNNYNTGRQVYVYENVPGGDWYRTTLQGWIFLHGSTPANFTPIDENRVGYRAHGKLKGTWGHNFYIVIQERNLDSGLITTRVVEQPGASGPDAFPVAVEEGDAARLRQALGLT